MDRTQLLLGLAVALFSLGELLEGFAAARARSGLSALAKLFPSQAVIEVDGERADGVGHVPVRDRVVRLLFHRRFSHPNAPAGAAL